MQILEFKRKIFHNLMKLKLILKCTSQCGRFSKSSMKRLKSYEKRTGYHLGNINA